MIQSFNQGGERTLRKVSLHLVIGELESTSWFHVIDAKVTYNVLLGKPWIHNRNDVLYTLHQCLKYCKDGGGKMVNADENPFTVEKAHFVDAKYYKKKTKPQYKEHPKAPQVPLSPQTAALALQKEEEDIVKTIKCLTLPLTYPEKVATLPLKGFLTPQERPKAEYGSMDSKAYDLLLKADYDPSKDKAMRQLSPEVIGDKVHGMNNTQRMIRQKGWSFKNPTMGLEFTSKPPLCILKGD
ncbi:hypothetical protein LIER_16460 [Lithospermum erythrorhizon]|uniref:Uncharacterized protein n=1 Tax=Lithospermum erythrorhizon TaxID=34254 RepID=A0AAV3Q6R3_LITER